MIPTWKKLRPDKVGEKGYGVTLKNALMILGSEKIKENGLKGFQAIYEEKRRVDRMRSHGL